MIKIQNINDASYKRIGKVVKDIDFSDLIAAMEATPCPDDVVYVASEAALEAKLRTKLDNIKVEQEKPAVPVKKKKKKVKNKKVEGEEVHE